MAETKKNFILWYIWIENKTGWAHQTGSPPHSSQPVVLETYSFYLLPEAPPVAFTKTEQGEAE